MYWPSSRSEIERKEIGDSEPTTKGREVAGGPSGSRWPRRSARPLALDQAALRRSGAHNQLNAEAILLEFRRQCVRESGLSDSRWAKKLNNHHSEPRYAHRIPAQSSRRS